MREDGKRQKQHAETERIPCRGTPNARHSKQGSPKQQKLRESFHEPVQIRQHFMSIRLSEAKVADYEDRGPRYCAPGNTETQDDKVVGPENKAERLQKPPQVAGEKALDWKRASPYPHSTNIVPAPPGMGHGVA